MNLLLIGPRGAGKSTVGRTLAERLGLSFEDVDELVLRRFNSRSVTEVWARHGEPAWRQAEQATLEECLKRSGRVLAVGGGLPMIPGARGRIESGRRSRELAVIYLRATIPTLQSRLKEVPGDRPRLTDSDALQEMELVLKQREPTYRQLADLIVDVDGLTPDQAACKVADWLNEFAP